MNPRIWFGALVICLTPLAICAQTATWVGGSGGNVFNVAANWNPASVPSGGSADLVFNTTTNTFVGFSSLPVSVNSLTFGSAATNQFFLNGNSDPTGLTIGAGGVTTLAGSGGATFNFGVNVALGANQTWTTAPNANITVQSNVSGSGLLTKAGSGSLILSGTNAYTGGTTVSAGTLYLGNSNSSSGTITVGSSGTLGAVYGDTTLGNAVALASGATLGGSVYSGESNLDLNGTVTLGSSTSTLNIGSQSAVFFGGTLTGPASTALTVQSGGTGLAVLAGSQSNISSMTANNAAIAFGNSAALPDTSVAATNGGYVSTVYLNGSSPTPTSLIAKITDKTNFNGVLGFDTDEDSSPSPHVYSDAINLAGFTNGNVRLGSLTSATLTGTITPVAQSYDFGGFAFQDGLLAVKSNLADNGGATSLSLVSPIASGGAPQNGMVLILQGNNSFTGNASVSYSSVIFDSTTALPATRTVTLGAYSYAGYTEGAGFADFAAFASRVTSTTATSILGIDSQDVIDKYVEAAAIPTPAMHTITDGAVNLSGFTSIYLGTLTGATINSTSTITAPSDGTLRLVNMGGEGGFIIESVLNQSNGLVVGMDGSEGAVILANQNTFSGNTTLLGGQLLVGNTTTTALSSGTLTVTPPTAGDRSVLGTALGSASLANAITVTGTTLQVGTGGTDYDDPAQRYLAGSTSLTLSGAIAGTGGLEITGLTTLSGTNTYTGGTTIRADTTVSNNAGLGTGFVNPGYSDSDSDPGVPVVPVRLTLTFTTSAPSIGFLADASQFNFGAGTGNINFTGTTPTLTINQNGSGTGTYSGDFTGNAVALVKNGSSQLALTGNNVGQIASTTIGAGSLAIGNSVATTATFGGDVTINATGMGTGLFFRPGGSQVMTYNGSISGVGAVTVNGSGGATTSITGGSSSFTGNTTVGSGTLRISGDDFWSSASATTVQGGATLWLDGNQTIQNLSGSGTVNIATGGRILTVNSASGTTFGGGITGSGGLTKTGGGSFTLSHISANIYTGNTIVSAGTLIVNGTLGSAVVTVNSGAFLMGTGTLNDVFLNGTYQPGNSAGVGTLDSLTMSSTGLLHMEIGGTGQGSSYDFLNISGAFAADGTLSVTFINAYNPGAAVSFNLFDFSSASGGFDSFNLPSLTSGLSWDTSALLTTGQLSITGTAIPEPSTYAAIFGAIALAGVMIVRRRRTA